MVSFEIALFVIDLFLFNTLISVSFFFFFRFVVVVVVLLLLFRLLLLLVSVCVHYFGEHFELLS